MAGTGTLNNFQITSQKRAREIRDIYGEAENKRNAIRQRSYNDILSQQSAIAAFNQRIAQMNSQATLASVFQQQQLMNKRAVDIEAAKAAYQQHYEQYGGTLNESALRFLDQHAKIDVPTFTSIMAGYEHAKASAEQRDRERIEAQVAMAEKSGALDKERAALIEKEIQARMEPEIQAYKSQIEMANARIKMLENQATEDAKFQLDKANAILRAFGGNGSGNAGLGASSLGNFPSARKKGEGGSGEPDYDAQLAQLDGQIRKPIENSWSWQPWVNTDNNELGINLITGIDQEKVLEEWKKRNPSSYREFEKQVNLLAEDKSNFNIKGEVKATSKTDDNPLGGATYPEDGRTNNSVIPANVIKAAARRFAATSLVTTGGDTKLTGLLNKFGRGEAIFRDPDFIDILDVLKRRLATDITDYRNSHGEKPIPDSKVDAANPSMDWTTAKTIISATPEIMAALTAGKKPSETIPARFKHVFGDVIKTGYGPEIPTESLADTIRRSYQTYDGVLSEDEIKGGRYFIKSITDTDEYNKMNEEHNAKVNAAKARLEADRAAAQAQAAPITQTQFEGYNLGNVLSGQTVPGPQGKYYYYENYPNFRGYGLANIEGLIPEFANRLGNFSNWYSNITGEPFTGSSAYRDVEHQRRVMSQYNDGRAAQPGYSYHGAGAAFDANWQTALAATQRAIRQNPNLLSEYGVTNAVELLDKGLAQYGLKRNLKSNPKEQHHIQAIADDAWNTAVNIELLDQHRKQGLLGTQLGSYYMRQQPMVSVPNAFDNSVIPNAFD